MSADSLGTAAKALLIRDGDAVLAALPSTQDQNDAIHAARKAIRRMRAVLALLACDGFDLERDDAALQRLGKSLSDLRDAHVVVETAKRLQASHPEPGWATIITVLELRRTRILQRALDQDPGFERRRRVIGQFVQRLQDQPWQSVRRAAVRDALERSERRVKKAGARAQHDPDPELVHRWRRKLRRLRMQLEAAQHIGALHGHGAGHAAAVRKAKLLHRTSDQLGWQQDLRLLRNLVRNLPSSAGKLAVLATIERALDGTGKRLQDSLECTLH